MIDSLYMYIILISFVLFALAFYLFSSRPYKTNLNNKILLKNLLESLDMDLPEELKGIDSPSPEAQKIN